MGSRIHRFPLPCDIAPYSRRDDDHRHGKSQPRTSPKRVEQVGRVSVEHETAYPENAYHSAQQRTVSRRRYTVELPCSAAGSSVETEDSIRNTSERQYQRLDDIRAVCWHDPMLDGLLQHRRRTGERHVFKRGRNPGCHVALYRERAEALLSIGSPTLMQM